MFGLVLCPVAALRAGIEAGTLRQVNPENVATVLWSVWNGIISLARRPDSLRRTEPELLATATDVIANGLLADQEG